MEEILKDQSTGFVPEEELLALAAMPDSLDGGGSDASSLPCAIATIVVSLSQAWGDACPTTACTSLCGARTA